MLQIIGSLQVGEDIGTTEAVDGLFGVSYQEQWCIRTAVYLFEYGVLHRIGILKLINQGSPVF